jgi:hypothetical protein
VFQSHTSEPITATNAQFTALNPDPGPAGPSTPFTVELELRHGEGSVCVETVYREIGYDPLPTISLSNNGAAFTNPIPLCDGAINTLTAVCSGCSSSSFEWNNSPTTPSISVTTQGGYYAVVSDDNNCRSQTEIALFTEATDGLNAAVVANPTDICSGANATLEVAPCVGCSYQWIDFSSANAIPLGQTYGTSDSGTYYAEVTNPQGCVYPTSTITLNLITLTIPSITSTTDYLCAGQTATLSTPQVSGYMYQWYFNTVLISVLTKLLLRPNLMQLDCTMSKLPIQIIAQNGHPTS